MVAEKDCPPGIAENERPTVKGYRVGQEGCEITDKRE
nr:hypothetical protein [Salmonella enterica]